MTTLPTELRQVLAANWTAERPKVTAEQVAGDGTVKWLLRLADAREVEAVFIPDDGDRGALCISTQVGCTLSCSFCHTGTMPLVRNLTVAEIVGQVLVAKDRLADWPRAAASKVDKAIAPAERRLTNIVVMGMGEPLLNYEALKAALSLAMDPEGLGLSHRRITVSTSGVVPRIADLGRDLATGLAISLHAVRDDLRDQLVPLNRKWNIEALINACRSYPVRRPITFEYVMLKGVNDSDADARGLVSLLRELPAKVNLIPFNPWPGSTFECSSMNRIRAFAGLVERGGLEAPVRTPRGRDILAACGQLKTQSERLRRHAA
jgi:23S rRNA (adenine2503-C2)-methyltransferase